MRETCTPPKERLSSRPPYSRANGHALGDALVDDVGADLGQPVDVGLAGAVVAALDGVVEEPVDGVAVLLVVLGRVDAALRGDRVGPARGVLVAEGLHVVAGLAERGRGGAAGQAGADDDHRQLAAVGRVDQPGLELARAPALVDRTAGRLGVGDRRRRACSSRARRPRSGRLPCWRSGEGGVRHVGHVSPYFEMTPARTKIGTSEKPPAMTTATRTPRPLACARAAAVLVSPRVWAALQVPWCRCSPSATIATR